MKQWVAWRVAFLALSNAESVGMAQTAARGIWGRLQKWQFFPDWSVSSLGVTEKLAAPE